VFSYISSISEVCEQGRSVYVNLFFLSHCISFQFAELPAFYICTVSHIN
jgi:hypothetical protein